MLFAQPERDVVVDVEAVEEGRSLEEEAEAQALAGQVAVVQRRVRRLGPGR